VNAVLQARQTQPLVTGYDGNPGDDSLLRRDDDMTTGSTSDNPVTDTTTGLQAPMRQTLDNARSDDTTDFGEFISGYIGGCMSVTAEPSKFTSVYLHC